MGVTSDVVELESLKHLRVTGTDRQGVWLVSLPRLAWNCREADEERTRLLRSLCQRYGWGCLWLGDTYSSAGGKGWHCSAETELLQMIRRLREGGWGLFFFGRDPKLSLPELDQLPAYPGGIVELLQRLSAEVAVLSWYDDTEWLVASRVEAS